MPTFPLSRRNVSTCMTDREGKWGIGRKHAQPKLSPWPNTSSHKEDIEENEDLWSHCPLVCLTLRVMIMSRPARLLMETFEPLTCVVSRRNCQSAVHRGGGPWVPICNSQGFIGIYSGRESEWCPHGSLPRRYVAVLQCIHHFYVEEQNQQLINVREECSTFTAPFSSVSFSWLIGRGRMGERGAENTTL